MTASETGVEDKRGREETSMISRLVSKKTPKNPNSQSFVFVCAGFIQRGVRMIFLGLIFLFNHFIYLFIYYRKVSRLQRNVKTTERSMAGMCVTFMSCSPFYLFIHYHFWTLHVKHEAVHHEIKIAAE